MKPLLRKALTLFMAFVVLTASMGFGVVEHHCLMRGKSIQLAILQKEGVAACGQDSTKAPTSDQTSFQKQNCCDDQQNYENVDVSSSFTQWIAKFLQIISDTVIGALVAVFKSIIAFFVASLESSDSLSSFSSLFHGRTLLSSIQSFLL